MDVCFSTVPEAAANSLVARILDLEKADAAQQAQLQAQLQWFAKLQQRVEDLAAAITQQSKPAEDIQAMQKVSKKPLSNPDRMTSAAAAPASDAGGSNDAGDNQIPQDDDPPPNRLSVEQQMLEYSWRPSIWDLSLFIGTDRLSIRASWSAAVCLICELILCAGLMFFCGEFSRSTFNTDTQREFHYWRTTVAHDVQLRNSFTGESLASNVCNERKYVPYANLQLEAVEHLSDYLDPLFWDVRPGSMMCSLVLCVWLMAVISNLSIIMEFQLACLSLPISSSTEFRENVMDPSKAELVSISPLRSFFMMLQCAVRTIEALFVGWNGSMFLIHETSVTDMLLNATALTLIFELEGLIFSALLPKFDRSMLDRIQPLKYSGSLIMLAGSFKIISVCFLMGLFLLFKVNFLDPFVVDLQDNLNALCGGADDSTLDFVVAVDSIGIPWASKTPSVHSISETYAQHAVSEAIKVGFSPTTEILKSGQRANLGRFMQVASALELWRYVVSRPESPQEWTVVHPENMDDVDGWNEVQVLGDKDLADGQGTVYNHYLQYLLGMSGEVSCADVLHDRCYQHGSKRLDVVMRKLCSSWCGCDSPTTGTVSSAFARDAEFGFLGCPTWATRKQKFKDALGELPCIDTNRSDVFVPWLQGVGDARSASGSLLVDHLLASFESGVCDAVAQVDLGSARLCTESSLPAICPVSCGCDTSMNWTTAHVWRLDYCPRSCGIEEQTCFTIAVEHTVETGDYGPLVGLPCIFPFTYKGKTHNNCTTDGWSGPWCAVTLMQSEGHNLHYWGDCPPGC